MDRFADDGKLGQGFTSADDLVEVDIGNGDKPRPTFISAKLDSKCKQQLTDLLKEYKDCFAWDYTEMPGLDRSIVEHHLLMLYLTNPPVLIPPQQGKPFKLYLSIDDMVIG